MKKIINFMFVVSTLLFITTLVSCGGSGSGSQTPENVAEKYVEAVTKMDFATMKKYAAASEIKSIEENEKEYKAGLPKEKESMMSAMLEGKNEVQPAVIDEKDPNKAKVIIKHTSKDGEHGDWTVRLIKEEGVWKVSNFTIK